MEKGTGNPNPSTCGKARRKTDLRSRSLITAAASILLSLAAAFPAFASAAECTDTWTGPAEGSWASAANWSAGHVPTTSDVACIGSGKTAKVNEAPAQVAVVQGEGSIYIWGYSLELTSATEASTIGALAITAGGSLRGAGTLEISSTLKWDGGSMRGSGSTVLLPGASATNGASASTATLAQRRFVNEGTFTLSTANMQISEGGEVLNAGTFVANSEFETSTQTVEAGSGKSLFVNTGTFKKTSGTGMSKVGVVFENKGTVAAKSGKLAYFGGGSSSGSNQWEASEGSEVQFREGSYALSGGTLSGAFLVTYSLGIASVAAEGVNAKAATVEVRTGTLNVSSGSVTVKSLTLKDGGRVIGAGTLNISNTLLWDEASMRGSGSTVILPGATGSSGSTEGFRTLRERRFVNEGTFTLSSANMQLWEGAELLNAGTFIDNSEPALYKSIALGEAPAQVVNTGTFKKTAGTGVSKIEVDFKNLGVLKQESGTLLIEHPITLGSSNHLSHRPQCGDPVECATGNFSETQTDFAIGGRGVGLELTRTYSAQAAASASSPGAFGYGWTSSFSDHLSSEESGKKITLTQADGGTVTFMQSGGAWIAPAWSQDTLSGSAETGYTLTLPEQTKYKFSGSGRLESLADRNGNETTLAYDEAGRLKTITDPAGREIKLTYNAGGQVESAEDPVGHLVKYTYESKNLKTVTLPGEASPNWQFTYDGSHRMTSMTDGRGGKTTNEYGSSSRVVSQTDPAGRTLAFEYNAFHTKITNKATGAVTDEWFTSNNQPYSITRGYGTAAATSETFTYNAAGERTTATDGNGHTTSYGYDAAGNKTSEKDAAGETKWTYNATHDVTSMTTPGGETTTIKRDANGNVESISRPAPEEATQTSTFAYDEHGQLESITDPLEQTWTYGYNAQGDRTSEADPLGDTQTLSYDKDSRLVSIVTPRGNVEGAEPSVYEVSIERDPQGRPLKATDPLGHTTEYAYDPNGNLKSKTDAKGNTTKYTYNADGEQTKVEKPNGAILETGYDGAGEVTSQTDANKNKTTFVRNVLEEPVEVIDPLGRKTIEEFDAAGNLKAVIDPAERKTTYAYDAVNRLIEVNYSEEATPDADFEYDADGNVTGMVDGTGTSSFSYDQLGRLTEAEDGHGDVVAYGYDLGEELIAITYPNGKSVSRAFDGAGRLESVKDWLSGTTSFSYDADSNLTGIGFPAATGNVDSYAYDLADRMSEAKFAEGAETLATLTYSREKLGQIEKEARSGFPGPAELSFAYDKNGRLTEAAAASFEYDPADNLTKGLGSTNTYDAASQLETGTGITYSYDKLGERVKTTPSAGPATTYKYDQTGDLIAVERPEEGEAPAINQSFAYDGSGLMASKTSGLTTRYLTWDASASLPLLLDDGENSYLYGPNGLPIEQISSEEEPTYLHHDQLGSTRMLTNVSGELSASSSYAPYGGIEGKTGTATTPLGFAAQYTDAQTGLQYLRARFYDPATAQFLSRDPLAGATRMPYGYGAENPLLNVDPSGMACLSTVGGYGISLPTVNPVDCAKDAVGGAAHTAASAPEAIFHHTEIAVPASAGLLCIALPATCPFGAAFSAGFVTGVNIRRALTEECFDFVHAELRSLLVALAAFLPGGIFDASTSRITTDVGLGPVARRIIQVILDGPGTALEMVHANSH